MAGEPYKREEEAEEDEEELDENAYKDQKDAVIFAIEVSESMLKPPPASDSKKGEKDSAVTAALKCAYQIMQQRIISQPNAMMGIILFGTKKDKGREEQSHIFKGHPHTYLFMDLDVPSAEDVKALRTLVEEGEDPDGILEPSGEPGNVDNLIFLVNSTFTTKAPNFGSRRLFLITDNDNPHADDKTVRQRAICRAKDLYDLGCIIELFPISTEDKKFDLGEFYDDVIYRDPLAEEDEESAIDGKSRDGLSQLSSLISSINSKQTPKRAYFSNLTFEIAPGLMIGVNGYITLNRQVKARTTYVWTDGEKVQIATGETKRWSEETLMGVDKKDVKKAYKFGGEYVYFKEDETKALKNWDMGPQFKGKGLRIIGFKPRSMLPIWASVKKSMFIFPSEVDYVGSHRVFSALWQKLLADKKMAIAWFVPRSNSNPLLVAILPTASRDDDDSSTPFLPAGLWLYPLPFADDIREIDKKPTKKCSPALIDQMRPVVQNLQLPKGMYDPLKYPNPSLQWHYKVLLKTALDEDLPDQSTHPDPTQPKYSSINQQKRVGGYIADFNKSVTEEAEALRTDRAIKRELEKDDDDGPPAKKAKAAPKKSVGKGPDAKALRKAVDQGTLSKMTIPDLKEVLSIRSLPVSGKKADLLERVEQWVEENT